MTQYAQANDKAAQRSLAEALRCAFTDIQTCIGKPDSGSEASHKLVHVDVTDDGQYNHKTTRVATRFVTDKLTERAEFERTDALKLLVRLSRFQVRTKLIVIARLLVEFLGARHGRFGFHKKHGWLVWRDVQNQDRGG